MLDMKINITEDTITKYLDNLQGDFHGGMEKHLEEMAQILTGKPGGSKGAIGTLMGDWNPNLYLSGQEMDRWLIKATKEQSSVTINYTGLTNYRRHLSDEFLVWWEFSREYETEGYYEASMMDASERHLDRDYAYFQETGEDEVADKKTARHTGAVDKGLSLGAPRIAEGTMKYFEKVMRQK